MKAQAALGLLCTGNEVAAGVGGLARSTEGVDLETPNVPCALSCESRLSLQIHKLPYLLRNLWKPFRTVPDKNCFSCFFFFFLVQEIVMPKLKAFLRAENWVSWVNYKFCYKLKKRVVMSKV